MVVVVRKWAEVVEGKVMIVKGSNSDKDLMEAVIVAVGKEVEVVEGNAPGKELEMALMVVVVVVVEVRRSMKVAERKTVVVGTAQGKVLAMEGAEMAAHIEGELEAVESKSEVVGVVKGTMVGEEKGFVVEVGLVVEVEERAVVAEGCSVEQDLAKVAEVSGTLVAMVMTMTNLVMAVGKA
ncbi:hypothetical protein Droror1_Dr00017840 [Drosera rotundifolia]